MNQLDRVPKEIISFWEQFETKDLKIQYVSCDSGRTEETYVFFLGLSGEFSPHKIFAFADKNTIIYYWHYDGVNNKQYSEKDFIRLINLKSFI